MSAGAAAGRLAFIDWLRAFSVLYIVGFWHMMEYWPSSEGCHNAVTSRITTVVLGLFTFLSGYLLAQKPLSWDAKQLGGFYLRRFLRLYPLYVGALVVFGLTGLADWKSVALSAVLVSPFLGHLPLTLWYVAVLLVFYVFAPFLLTARSAASLLFRSVAIFGVLVAAVKLLPHADARIVIYFPCFALGIHAARDVLPKRSERMTGPLVLLAIFITAGETAGALAWLWMAGLAASGSLLIFRWALRGRATRRPFALVLFISTAAYVMYLSHRPILLAATSLFFPAAPSAQLAWLVAICLPFIVVFSWALQQLYDAGLAMVIGRRVDAGSAPRLS